MLNSGHTGEIICVQKVADKWMLIALKKIQDQDSWFIKMHLDITV